MPVRIPRNRPPKIIISEQDIGPKIVSDTVMMQKIMGKLREADINHDGCYDRDELKHALKDLGAILPGWRANRCLVNVDANHDGQISGAEIDALVDYLLSWGFGKK